MTDPLDDDMTEPKVETAAPIEPAKPEVLPPQSQLPVKAQVQAQQNVMVIMPTNIEECYRAAELFKLAGMVPESLQAKNGDHRETVANSGIKGGRLNETGEVYLTNAIEFIPTTKEAEKTYVKFIEDKK